MSVGVDRQDAAGRDGMSRAFGGEVQAMRRAVDLQGGARPGRLGVDGLPVEIEIVACLDHPAGGMGDDVDVRTADGIERSARELSQRLAPRHVDGRHDDLEPREEVVLVIEDAVGPDLELATVEQPKALRRRLGRRRPVSLFGFETLVQGSDDRALFLHPIGGQSARNRERLRVIRQDLV